MSQASETPFHKDFQSSPPAPSRRGCLGVGIGCALGAFVLGVLLCGGFIGGAVYLGFSMIKSAEPYQRSLQAAKSSTEVQEALGSPIEAGMMVTGSINLNNAEGDADLSYDVSGPKGSATVTVNATRQAGRWSYDSVLVRPRAGGADIDLTDQLNAGADEVPNMDLNVVPEDAAPADDSE